MPESAFDVAEAMLARTGEATMSRDFDLYKQCFHLPSKIETYSGVIAVGTLADLREVFDTITRQFDAMGVTDFVRRVLEAEFHGSDEVSSAHETRLMRSTFVLRDPYPSYCTLKRFDGIWKIIHSTHAVTDINSIYNLAPPSDDGQKT